MHCHLAVLALRLSFIHSKEAFQVEKFPFYLWNLVTSVGELGRGHRRAIQKWFEITTPLNCLNFSNVSRSLLFRSLSSNGHAKGSHHPLDHDQTPGYDHRSRRFELEPELHLQVLLQVLLFYLHMVTPALPKIHNAKAEEHEILGSRWLLIANNSPRLMEPLQISVSFPQVRAWSQNASWLRDVDVDSDDVH